MLRSVLSAHSRMVITPETHFMKEVEKEGGLDRGAPADFDAFWGSYADTIRFKDLGVDADRCLGLVDQLGERTFCNIFAALLTAYGERAGKERVGEKTPGHVHFLPQLLEWFPDARVIVMQRDPRAVVASQLRSPWVQKQFDSRSWRHGLVPGTRLYQVAYYADDWVGIYERIVPSWRGDSRVRVVSYEALVEDVESEVRALCDFLGEPFEPAMLGRRSSDSVPRPAGTEAMDDGAWREWRREHHAKTLRPVSSDSLDKWREGLTKTEVAMIEGWCFRGMRALGYTPISVPLQLVIGRALVQATLTTERVEQAILPVARRTVGVARRGIRRALAPFER